MRYLDTVLKRLVSNDLSECAVNVVKHCTELQEEIASSKQLVLERMDAISCNLVGLLDLSNALIELHDERGMRQKAGSIYKKLYRVMQNIATDYRLYQALSQEVGGKTKKGTAEEMAVGMSFMQGFKNARESLTLDGPTKRYANRPTVHNLHQLMLARMRRAKEMGSKSYAHMIMQRHCVFREPEGAIAFITNVLGRTKLDNNISKGRAEKCTFNETIDLFGEWLQTNNYLMSFDDHVIKLSSANDSILLGEVYLDLLQRRGRSPNPMHFTIQSRHESICQYTNEGHAIVAIAINRYNGKEDLLDNWTIRDSEMLFHELGHASHTVLSGGKYHHLSGTRCPIDVSEFPSISFEYLFGHLNKSDCTFGQTEWLTELYIALCDLLLHSKDEIPESVHAFWRLLETISEQATDMLGFRPKRFADLSGVEHLGDYGSAFYAYPMCRYYALGMRERGFEGLIDVMKVGGMLDGRHLVVEDC